MTSLENSSPSPYLFEVVDFQGRRVICTQECWQGHILDEHPFMEDEVEAVIEALRSPYPLCVYQDRDYPERQIYYLLAPSKDYYTKVVVDFSQDGFGEVVTAFQPDSPKQGEILIWPASDD